MENPYQSPKVSITGTNTHSEKAPPSFLTYGVGLATAGMVYLIGQHSIGQADGCEFPSTYLCLAMLSYFVAFLLQPMTEFGMQFSIWASCVAWAWFAMFISGRIWNCAVNQH